MRTQNQCRKKKHMTIIEEDQRRVSPTTSANMILWLVFVYGIWSWTILPRPLSPACAVWPSGNVYHRTRCSALQVRRSHRKPEIFVWFFHTVCFPTLTVIISSSCIAFSLLSPSSSSSTRSLNQCHLQLQSQRTCEGFLVSFASETCSNHLEVLI